MYKLIPFIYNQGYLINYVTVSHLINLSDCNIFVWIPIKGNHLFLFLRFVYPKNWKGLLIKTVHGEFPIPAMTFFRRLFIRNWNGNHVKNNYLNDRSQLLLRFMQQEKMGVATTTCPAYTRVNEHQFIFGLKTFGIMKLQNYEASGWRTKSLTLVLLRGGGYQPLREFFRAAPRPKGKWPKPSR